LILYIVFCCLHCDCLGLAAIKWFLTAFETLNLLTYLLTYTDSGVFRSPRRQLGFTAKPVWSGHCSICSSWPYEVDGLTTDVDLDLTEVEHFVNEFRLHDEISARRHARGARQADSGSFTHNARIPSTQVVVPQCRRRNCRRHVRQSDDEVIRTPTWSEKVSSCIQTKRVSCKWREALRRGFYWAHSMGP